METFVFLARDVILAIHEEQLAQHGGRGGVRDEGLLESAIARPIDHASYDETVDVAAMAADYAFGISRNHPFIDGNKRTAFVTMELFLELNGYRLNADDEQALLTMLSLASGDRGVDDFVDWLRSSIEPEMT